MAEIQHPTAGLQPGFFGDVRESAIPIVVEQGDAAAIVGGLEAFRKKSRRLGFEEADGLEVGADEEIHVTVVVVVERDGCDRVQVLGKPGLFGHLAKLAVSEVLKQLVLAEADYQQVGPAVVVVVEP